MLTWIFVFAIFVFAFVAGLSSKKNSDMITNRTLKSDYANSQAIKKIDAEEKAKDQELLKAVLGMYSKERSVSFFVNGGQYRTEAAQEEYCILSVGMDVKLKAEPENKYDKYAVKVMSSRKHIGYVSKEESKLVYQVVEQGCVSDCIVIDNDYAKENYIPKLMHVRLFITSDFVNKWELDGYDDPVEKS